MGMVIDFELVRRLRKAFQLYEGYSTQQVLDITKGTTTRAFIELGLAFHRLSVETKRASVSMRHLNEVTETYPQHARFALWGAGQCLLAAGALVIHAVWPRWFTRSASTRIKRLLDSMNERYSK